MRARIELFDDGPDAAPLAIALLGAGFEVAVCPLKTLPSTSASLAVVAGDQAGALDALRKLRDDGASPDTPVILLGTPAGTGHRGDGPGFGAEAVLLRPASPARLVAVVHKLLRVRAPSVTTGLGLRPGADPAFVETGVARRDDPAIRRPPERTVQLRDTGVESVVGHGDPSVVRGPVSSSRVLTPSPAELSTAGVSSSGLSGSGISTGVGSSSGVSSGGLPRGPSAAISERLQGLLEQAFRRAFPNRAPIDLSLPGGDEPAEALVPAELLEQDEPAQEWVAEDDPIEAYTYVGGLGPAAVPALDPRGVESGAAVPTAHPSANGAPAPGDDVEGPPFLAPSIPRPDALRGPDDGPEPGPSEGRPGTSPGTPGSLSRRPRALAGEALRAFDEGLLDLPVEAPLEAPLEPAGTDLEHRGQLRPGRVLELLWTIALRRLDARATFRPGVEGPCTELVFRDGELVSMGGPVEGPALAWLERRGVPVRRVEGASAAAERLDDACERLGLSELQRGRALREGRTALLRAWLRDAGGSFELERLHADARGVRGPAPLGLPFRMALLDACRASLDAAWLESSIGRHATLRLGPRFAAAAEDGLIAPELAALLAAEEGLSWARLSVLAAEEPGLPGLVAALLAGRALVMGPAADAPAPMPSSIEVRARLEQAAALAEESDYFHCLGADPEATPFEIGALHARRVVELDALPLDALGLRDELGPVREAVRAALDEAHRVLSSPRWSAAYRAALAAAPRLADRGPGH